MRRRYLLELLTNLFKWFTYPFKKLYYSLVPEKVNKNPELPNDYQEVEYIESSGTQYFDSGVYGTLDTKIKINVSINNPTGSDLYNIFGVRTAGNSKAFLVGKTSASDNSMYSQFDTVSSTIKGYFYPTANQKLEIELSKNGYYVNNTLYRTYENPTSFTTDTTILLLAHNRIDNVGIQPSPLALKLYSRCEIYENDVLIRNFITCYRKSDNVIGLYDTVNGVFYVNQGTGTFAKGSDVFVKVRNKAKVKKIYGDSVVENQWVKNTATVSSNGITLTNNGDGSYSLSGTASADTYFAISDVLKVKNHSLLVSTGLTTQVSGVKLYNGYTGGSNVYTTSIINNTADNFLLDIVVSNGTVLSTPIKIIPQLIDLTQMFPFDTPTSLDDPRVQALLNRGYIPYNTGEIKSVDIGEFSSECFNIWDEQWELISNAINSKNFIRILPSTTYYFKRPSGNGFDVRYYDSEQNPITSWTWVASIYNTITTPNNAYYMKFRMTSGYGTTYNNDICINVSSSMNGTYKPHKTFSPLPFIYQGNGVNTAKDTYELTKTSHIFTKKQAFANLEMQTWTYDSTNNRWRSTSLENLIKAPSSNSNIVNAIAEKYTLKSFTDAQTSVSGLACSTSATLSYYTTDSVNAPSGKMIYELATPQVITIPRKRLGIVDLGSLNWAYASGAKFFYASTTNLNAKGANANEIANIYCSMYISKSKNDTEPSANYDNSVSITNSTTTNPNRLSIKNVNYTDATVFKNAMSGQYLFYETETEVDDIADTLDIEAGGTLTANWFSWVRNQLVAYSGNRSTTINDVVITDNNNGSYTFNGTASAEVNFYFNSVNIVADHYYLLKGCPAGGSYSTYALYCSASMYDTGEGKIYKFTSSSSPTMRITITNGTQINKVFYPNLIDLTLAFGSGKEPTSIDDPRIKYILEKGYIPTDTTGTLESVDCEVLPDVDVDLKCK